MVQPATGPENCPTRGSRPNRPAKTHFRDERRKMNDESSKPPEPDGRDQTPSDLFILGSLALIALACVGGYFLLMKLVDISRQEDCVLAHRRNCADPIEVPTNR